MGEMKLLTLLSERGIIELVFESRNNLYFRMVWIETIFVIPLEGLICVPRKERR
jgi:hypothetical protein